MSKKGERGAKRRAESDSESDSSERESDFHTVAPKTRSQARRLDLLLGDNGSPPGPSNAPDNHDNDANQQAV